MVDIFIHLYVLPWPVTAFDLVEGKTLDYIHYEFDVGLYMAHVISIYGLFTCYTVVRGIRFVGWNVT